MDGQPRSCSSESDFTTNGYWYTQPHHDGPSGDGSDNEPRAHAGPNGDGDVCDGEEPIDVKCVTSTGVHGSVTTAEFTCSIEHGFSCRASENHGKCPYDFYVMYKCPEIDVDYDEGSLATCETVKNDHRFCGPDMDYDPTTSHVLCRGPACERADRSRCCKFASYYGRRLLHIHNK